MALDERDATLLALRVLSQTEPRSYPSSIPIDVVRGHVEVDVRVEGAIATLCRHIWVDQANVAAMITDELRAQLEPVHLREHVRASVAKHISRVLTQMDANVERVIGEHVRALVRERVDQQASKIASKIDGAITDALQKAKL